ncbi:MAG TPA: class I SAM-dependent methyltransferase [Solirubrobacteraceae bacterium]|nr:class I SAM-dependent methyltransferase [Solirubrobacteraceae bacterium]
MRISKNWDARVPDAELIARSAGFCALRERIVQLAEPQSGHVVVDVGSGTGLLALAFAERAARVWAIDSSPAMNEYLRVKAISAELDNIEPVLASAVSLPLVDGIADLVVSNYCMHELRGAEKDRALAEAMRVLKPGGRLVIGDMMFSFNPMRPRDRHVVALKLRTLLRRGLPGVFRLLKNAARLASGRGEHPANVVWWREALERSGFHHVKIEVLAHEGGIAVAQAPATGILPYGSASTEAVPGTRPSEASRASAPGVCLR